MNIDSLHKQRLFIIIACLLGVVSIFLPWIKISAEGISMSFNGMDKPPGEGWNGPGALIVLIIFIVAAILTFLGNQKQALSQNAWLLVMVLGAANAVITLIKVINKCGVPTEGMKEEGGSIHIGYGLIIALLCSAAVVGIAYVMRAPGQDLQKSLGEMKKTVENKLDNDPNT